MFCPFNVFPEDHPIQIRRRLKVYFHSFITRHLLAAESLA